MSTYRFRTVRAAWPWTIRKNIEVVSSQWLTFAIITGVCFFAAAAVDHMFPRFYTSQALIISEPESVNLPPFGVTGSSFVNVSGLEYMQTQVEQAHSFAVIAQVTQKEHLQDQITNLSTPLDQLSSLVDDAQVKVGLLPAPDPGTAKLARAGTLLSGRVTTDIVKDSYILSISVSTRDPKLSKRIATALVAAYLDHENAYRLRQLKAAETVLFIELTDSQSNVAAAQAALVDFDRVNGTVFQTSTQTSQQTTSGGSERSSSKQTTEVATRTSSLLVARQGLQWKLDSERARYLDLQRQIDTTREEESITGDTSATSVLTAPQASLTPDGISLKYRLLIYLILAPLVGIAGCYLLRYLSIYRRATTLQEAKRA
jgi:uncharacterized protein involved in exopolysaccharide biosynthesis